MSLPLVNANPNYELVIPSTKQVVRYRPYLVKEEKILLLAFESKDTKASIHAMLDVVKACVNDNINVYELSTFDVEYMFLQIRSKSVGETSTIIAPCSKCEEHNEVSIPLNDIKIDIANDHNNVIKLTDTISVEMRYLTYLDAVSGAIDDYANPSLDSMITMIARGIKAVLTQDQRFDSSEYTEDEISEFIDNLSSEQFQKIAEFYANTPKLSHKHEFQCTSCGSTNNLNLSGIADFF
jgi:hypothetical protein